MSARTLVLPTVAGIALMACGGGEMTSPTFSHTSLDSTVSVTHPSVEVTPRTATVSRGARLSLFLTLKGFGSGVSDRAAIWTSSDSRVVEVSRLNVNREWSTSIPSAVAYAAGTGAATVTVSVAGQSASARITVTDAATTNRESR
jgi:uncharacterized protein YjdB